MVKQSERSVARSIVDYVACRGARWERTRRGIARPNRRAGARGRRRRGKGARTYSLMGAGSGPRRPQRDAEAAADATARRRSFLLCEGGWAASAAVGGSGRRRARMLRGGLEEGRRLEPFGSRKRFKFCRGFSQEERVLFFQFFYTVRDLHSSRCRAEKVRSSTRRDTHERLDPKMVILPYHKLAQQISTNHHIFGSIDPNQLLISLHIMRNSHTRSCHGTSTRNFDLPRSVQDIVRGARSALRVKGVTIRCASKPL
jgi:hypothetical protein